MCVDIFAPGFPITLDFLHERLYFVPGHNCISVYEWCDAFIRNDHPTERIENLRIQLPHHVEWTPNAGGPRGIEANEGPMEQPLTAWYGSFTPDDTPDDVTHDPDSLHGLYKDTRKHTAPLLAGDFLQPPHTEMEWGQYAEIMRNVPATVLDLKLRTRLEPGRRGLLRLDIRPTTWPGTGLLALPNSSPFGGES